MKRTDLMRHLLRAGCTLVREGAKHSVFLNSVTKRMSTAPRHNEIHNHLAEKICRDLGIEKPSKY